jgi:hypothetical protein
MTTYTHNSELQAITVPLTNLAIHKSPQHPLSIFQPVVSSPAIPWQWLLTVKILQLHMLRFYLHSVLCRTLSQLIGSPQTIYLITPLHRLSRKHLLQQKLYHCRGVFTASLHSNGCCFTVCFEIFAYQWVWRHNILNLIMIICFCTHPNSSFTAIKSSSLNKLQANE